MSKKDNGSSNIMGTGTAGAPPATPPDNQQVTPPASGAVDLAGIQKSIEAGFAAISKPAAPAAPPSELNLEPLKKSISDGFAAIGKALESKAPAAAGTPPPTDKKEPGFLEATDQLFGF